MRRMACVNLFSFSLQILLKQYQEWLDFPVAVITRDNATGRIVELNRHARKYGLKKNESYVTALSMCPVLKAQVVGEKEIQQHTQDTVVLLRRFSPMVEGSAEHGVFWVDCSGIDRLYSSEWEWANTVRGAVRESGFFAGVCVGSSKFGTYAVARWERGVRVFETEEQEQHAVFHTPLSFLDVSTKDLELLERLGVSRLGDLLALPAESLKSRFSAALFDLHRRASAAQFYPFVPQKEMSPITTGCQLDGVQSNALALLFVSKTLLESLLSKLLAQKKVLHRLQVTFVLAHAPETTIEIVPAMPTMNMALWMELLRLKLERLKLADNVDEVILEARAAPATFGQLALFQHEHKRNIEATNRALARLRAKFGDQSVLYAQVTEGHLPGASYQLLPLKAVTYPKPGKRTGALVRRILDTPVLLNSRPVKGPAGVHFGGLGKKAVKEMLGPYVIEGGWWVNDICREYYFAKTEREILWVYFDRRRRQWFLQGQVE
ncbi:MAG: DNA polymerase Y family protein [Deltaproteobacteria bacterium]|nr:DNA polymerase Y family protein [Deltaproteobacteria bacterium]MBN2673032.1 DNA polymerase Y family protein [Deltaproteobacteria bacterium]